MSGYVKSPSSHTSLSITSRRAAQFTTTAFLLVFCLNLFLFHPVLPFAEEQRDEKPKLFRDEAPSELNDPTNLLRSSARIREKSDGRGNQTAPATAHSPTSHSNNQSHNRTTPRPTQRLSKYDAPLSCHAFQGPSPEAAAEVVYWRRIGIDQAYRSPFYDAEHPRYLTFEPDEAGFNNQRMAFETTVALAWLTGRILVLPPSTGLLHQMGHKATSIGLSDFFDLAALQEAGLPMISFEEFLQSVALQGQLIDQNTGWPAFPPGNQTNWDSSLNVRQVYKNKKARRVWDWLRGVTHVLDWDGRQCVAAIPDQKGSAGVQVLQQALEEVRSEDAARLAAADPGRPLSSWQLRYKTYQGKPTPVNATAKERLGELLGDRTRLCIYDESLQQAQVLHITGEEKSGTRLLIHYYAFLFPAHWQAHLRMLRLVRDHVRYRPGFHCAAARIVEALHWNAREVTDGSFYSMHVRRGDFRKVYPKVFLDANEIYDLNTRLFFGEGRTIYIATDERDASFFEPLRKHYHLLFLDDFLPLLEGIHPAFYGMIDQLVAASAVRFFGTMYSTFSGYIHRLRGFYAQQREEDPATWGGTLDSYYLSRMNPCPYRKIMARKYMAVKAGYWETEFAVAWRDIDHDLEYETLSLELLLL